MSACGKDDDGERMPLFVLSNRHVPSYRLCNPTLVVVVHRVRISALSRIMQAFRENHVLITGGIPR